MFLRVLVFHRSRCEDIVQDFLAATFLLPHLTHLILPTTSYQPRDRQLNNIPPWPPNLTFLRLPKWFNWSSRYCRAFVHGWPQSLKGVEILSRTSYRLLRYLLNCEAVAPHVQDFDIGASLTEDDIPSR